MVAIGGVLAHDWNPIGLQDEDDVYGEYEWCIGAVYRLLSSGCTEAQIIDHLHHLQTNDMGLPSRDKALLTTAAQRLLALMDDH